MLKEIFSYQGRAGQGRWSEVREEVQFVSSTADSTVATMADNYETELLTDCHGKTGFIRPPSLPPSLPLYTPLDALIIVSLVSGRYFTILQTALSSRK